MLRRADGWFPSNLESMAKPRSWLLAAIASICVLAGCGQAAPPQHLKVASPRLSAFWHRPIAIEADVLLPPSYATSKSKRYPVIYWIHAFGGSYHIGRTASRNWRNAMARAGTEYIVVSLNAAFNGVHDAFADSANNGPWGTALVREFIPAFDRDFRTIPAQRFVAGHSSGGWTALWLQVNYPRVFSGAWSIAPDPVDFRDFTGPDLTRIPPQNFYTDSRGREYPFDRRAGHDVTTLRDFVQRVPWAGAQFDSFDAVFSPRGAGGRPEPLFDRRTGAIDAGVARYWEAHYDIDALLQRTWAQNGPSLRDKLHVFVGTVDTYHLDGPVRRFASEMATLHGSAEVVFVQDADHNDIFKKGDLIDRMVLEMTHSDDSADVVRSAR